jgi:hypothetical protein
MTQGFTDSLLQHRLIVVAVDKAGGRVRVKNADDACSELSCSGGTEVCCDEGTSADLESLNPGDVVKLEGPAGRPERIVVVRRAWDEITSPEW